MVDSLTLHDQCQIGCGSLYKEIITAMIDKPLTFLFDFDHTNNTTRPYVMKKSPKTEPKRTRPDKYSDQPSHSKQDSLGPRKHQRRRTHIRRLACAIRVTGNLDVPDPKLRPLVLTWTQGRHESRSALQRRYNMHPYRQHIKAI